MSERYLCLNCWRAVPRADAYFRCEGCEAGDERPGWMQRRQGTRRRLSEVRRPWWTRLLAEDGAVERPCKRHPEAPFQLFCECGYPLSERAALARRTPLGLGIAGPRSAGKTLLIITLIQELHRLEVDGKKLGAVGLDDTESRFHGLSAGFYDHGDKPHATPLVDAEPARWDELSELPPGNFSWTLSLDDGRRRGTAPVLLAVNDLGGETWGLPKHERRETFDRYLAHLGSLIFLLDAHAMAAGLGFEVEDAWDEEPTPADRGAMTRQWFSRIAERLDKRARQVDLAFVVSKADVFWDLDGWQGLRPDSELGEEERQALIEKLLQDSERRDVLIESRQRFRNVRLFAVSSLGFLPAHDDVDGTGRLRRRGDPAAVTEPLVWLLRQRLPGLK